MPVDLDELERRRTAEARAEKAEREGDEAIARAEAAESALVALRMAVAGPGSDRAAVAKMWHGQLMEMARALHDGIAGGQSYIAALKAENERLREACTQGAVYLEALHSDLIANDADMMIDTPVSPADVAADLRTALETTND